MSDVVTVTYRPTEDEPYMNKKQQEYFRRKLIGWREEILRGSNETLRQLKEEDNRVADMSDWASVETERNFSCAPAIASASCFPRSTRRSSGSTTAPTAIARRPRSRSGCGGSRRGRSPP